MKSVKSAVSKLDKSIMNLLDNNIVRFLLLLSAVAYLLMIKHIPSDFLENFKNIYVRIIMALAIAYLACFNPLYAVFLGTIFILSLQELHRRNVLRDSETLIKEKRHNLDQLKNKKFL